MNEPYIGRKSAIWLWLETTPWTKAQPIVRIPKESGSLNPTFEEAIDQSWYGVIDRDYDSFTTKNTSWLPLTAIVKDNYIGYILKMALGKYTKLHCVKWTVSWGTPKRWDITTNGGATLKKVLNIWWTNYYFFDKAVSWNPTNGTWTITATQVGINAHLFERLNSNSHPSATIYDTEPVASSYAPYCMINSFELTCEVADYVKFSAEFMGKQMHDASGDNLTPAYGNDNPFLASMANVSFATNETWLNDAQNVCMQNFRFTINKDLTDVQCFGDTDVSGIFNQAFSIEGDFEALYKDTTLRDFVINSEKKAVRFQAINEKATATAGIHPSIYVDLMKVGLNNRTKSDGNDEIVKETMGFTAQFDNQTGASIEILLINDNSTGY